MSKSKGHYIHMARLKNENEQLHLQVIHRPAVMQTNHEASFLKLRITSLEEQLERKEAEIQRLIRLLNLH